MDVRYHVSKAGDVARIRAHGLDPAATADGLLWLCSTLDAARVWWRTFELQRRDPSLWRVDADGLDVRARGFRAEVVSEPVGPERLVLLHHGQHPDWLALDPAAQGQSVWHKECPDEFWERMRLLHGDVGPGR